nr:hypothetical protein [Tanacetum cinerariifolium]
MEYQALKRKPLTEAQVRRNMIVYFKNIAGYKMDYFKEMRYDEIRPLFEKHYDYNQAFLNEVNKGVKVPEKEVSQEKEVEVEISKREGKSLEQEIAKKQKIEQEIEELKKHLQIVFSMLDVNDEEPVDVEEVLEVVKVAKLITKVVTTAGVDVNAASVQDTSITATKATKVIVPRKKRGVII